jgi:hypothetical protein
MAVYEQGADGKRTRVQGGQTLSEVVNSKVEELKAQGIQSSPCVQEILGTQPKPELKGEEI